MRWLLILVPIVIACMSCGGSDTVSISGYKYVPVAGPQGPQGTPGTIVGAIQFCVGYTTTYPTSFPEYGVCIDNRLYAVYWDHTNAWLAEVVPGNYLSTSTSAPCNFTVLTDCIIQTF